MPKSTSPTVVAGAFMIKEWVAGDHMTLVPNPNYYGAKPKLSEIDIKFVPDTDDRFGRSEDRRCGLRAGFC